AVPPALLPPGTAYTSELSFSTPPRPFGSGSAASTCSSLCSVSPSCTGPVWSQDSQPSTVARLGNNRVVCARASPMVCPPYTRRCPPTRQSWCVAAIFRVSLASSGSLVTTSAVLCNTAP